MKFLAMILLFIPTSTFASMAFTCPAGKKCVKKIEWKSHRQLMNVLRAHNQNGRCDVMVDGAIRINNSEEDDLEFGCEDGRLSVTEIRPHLEMIPENDAEERLERPHAVADWPMTAENEPKLGPLEMRSKGDPLEEVGAGEVDEATQQQIAAITSQCEEGKGQEQCLKAHQDLLKFTSNQVVIGE